MPANSKLPGAAKFASYVPHPYQLVKDHRTGHEVGNASGVLDGNLNSLIEQALLKKVF